MSDTSKKGDVGVYTIGHEPAALAVMKVRTAEVWADFLLPHLRSGMRLLDCGCGPGTITAGLARAVAPGDAIGFDREESQLEEAVAHARELGVSNLRFQAGDALALPFPDESFDAVFAHALLMHVPDPLGVLREMYRVLRPAGVLGVSDPMIDGWIVTGPERELLTQTFDLLKRATAPHGGDWNRGRYLVELVHKAGFTRLQFLPGFQHSDDVEKGQGARVVAGMISATRMAETIVAQGLAERSDLERLAAAWRRLPDYPDGYFAAAEVRVLGWRPA